MSFFFLNLNSILVIQNMLSISSFATSLHLLCIYSKEKTEKQFFNEYPPQKTFPTFWSKNRRLFRNFTDFAEPYMDKKLRKSVEGILSDTTSDNLLFTQDF